MGKRAPVDSCLVPKPVSPDEAKIYASLRDVVVRSHCAAGRSSHLCCGAITMTRSDMTLNCPLCGDAKSLIAHPKDER